MIDETDYIIKRYYCSKTGKCKPQRWFMHYCGSCGLKRSYLPRSKGSLCSSCASIGKSVSYDQRNSISNTLRYKYSNKLIDVPCNSFSEEKRRDNAAKAVKTKQMWSDDKKRAVADKIAASKMDMSIDEYRANRSSIMLRRRLAHNIRSMLGHSIRGNVGKLRHVDWSVEDLKKHLESQFQPGMSWDNYGRKPGIKCWEIDHVTPINATRNGEYLFKNLDDSNSDDFKRCWSLDNLQPMWAEDNNVKNNKCEE